MEKTACFTGHRLQKFGYNESSPLVLEVKKKLYNAIEDAIKLGYETFISGGAIGVDQWAMESVIALKKNYPHIKLIVAKPFPSQDKIWPQDSRMKFQDLCSKANEIVDVSPDPYFPWKMQVRNEYMVNKSSLVIAVWDGTKGGTANTVAFAQKKGKNIVRISL